MKRSAWILAASLAAVVTAPHPEAKALSNEIPKGIGWVNEWDRALATAAERGVPILVSFANDD